MRIEVNLKKKYFFSLLAVLIVLSGALVVYAYSITPGASINPGHLLAEMQGYFSGDSNLQVSLGKFCQSDGTNCQAGASSPVSPGCKAGFIATGTNSNLCIETNERAAVDWFTASSTCNSVGANLCDADEWYAACSEVGSSLNSITGNWEWTSEMDDIGSGWENRAIVVGGTDCKSTSYKGDSTTGSLTRYSSAPYRCCYKSSLSQASSSARINSSTCYNIAKSCSAQCPTDYMVTQITTGASCGSSYQDLYPSIITCCKLI